MTKQTEATPPEKGGIIAGRFKCVEMVQDKMFLIWDVNNPFNPSAPATPWCGFEYWDEESRTIGAERMRFITGMLNGIRDRSDLITM